LNGIHASLIYHHAIFSVGLFDGGLCSPTSHYTGTEGLHPRGNSRNSSKYAEESHGQCQTTCRDVPYLQWSSPE
jgi:hypothetical protein